MLTGIPVRSWNTGDLTHRYLHGPQVDQVLVDEVFSNSGGQQVSNEVLWLLADHQGTIRDVVDSTGTLRKHVDYDSFGQVTGENYFAQNGTPITSAHAEAIDQLFYFQGREFDQATGLSNHRARWYDPGTGRFLNEDPSGFSAGDPNLYRFAANNPVSYTDPTGLKTYKPTEYLPALGPVNPYSTASRSTPSVGVPTADQSLRQMNTSIGTYDYYNNLASQTQLTVPGSAVTRTVNVPGLNPGEAVRAPWHNSADAFLAARSGTNDVLSPRYFLDAAYTARAAVDYAIGNIFGGVQDLLTPPTAPTRIDYHANGTRTIYDGDGLPTIAYVNQAALLAPPVLSGTSRPAGQLTVGTAERIAPSNGTNALRQSGSHPTTYVPGRYSHAASDPGAYWSSSQRVFPTTRNSGLKSAELRAEQESFFARGLQEGRSPAELRGQAAVAGYERRGGINNVGGPDRLADRGAENALQRAIQHTQPSGKVGR